MKNTNKRKPYRKEKKQNKETVENICDDNKKQRRKKNKILFYISFSAIFYHDCVSLDTFECLETCNKFRIFVEEKKDFTINVCEMKESKSVVR